VNDQTKQRVIGTVVLLALALIFLPIILDGDGSYQRTINSRIPPVPMVREMPDPIPLRPVIDADSMEERVTDIDSVPVSAYSQQPTADDANAPTLSSSDPSVDATSDSTSTPQLDANGLPLAWSVRLGTFSNPVNAQKLSSDLMASGYRAYTRAIQDDQNSMTMVLVGPQVDRNMAEELRGKLQAEFQLDGLIVRYEIDSLD